MSSDACLRADCDGACRVFIAHSQNKSDGTRNILEHRISPFVVGAGNANTPGDNSMSNRFLMSVTVAALMAGTGFANAQGTGVSREGSTVQQNAPPTDRAAPAAEVPMN